MAEQLVFIDGIKISYVAEGDPKNPTIIFLHGLAGSKAIWANAIKNLKKTHYCIGLDLPGHGRSEKRSYAYTPFFFASTLESFCKKLKLTSFYLAGHSMGGQIAIVFALRFPAMVKKLILVSPAGFEVFTEEDKATLRHLLSYTNAGAMDFTKMAGPWTALNIPGMTENFAPEAVIKACAEGMLSEPVFENLKNIQVPTLVIFGENDLHIPNKLVHHHSNATIIGTEGTKLIKNATLQIIPDSGHFVPIDQPVALLKSITGFLKV